MNNNLATVHKIYEAFGKGNIPAILDCLADNVQWEQWVDNSTQKAGVPWMEARNGKDGALEFFKIIGSFNFREFQVLSIMSNDKQVAAEISVEAEIPSTGAILRDEEIHLWTFDEDGKISRFRHYNDTAKHIEAAKKGSN